MHTHELMSYLMNGKSPRRDRVSTTPRFWIEQGHYWIEEKKPPRCSRTGCVMLVDACYKPQVSNVVCQRVANDWLKGSETRRITLGDIALGCTFFYQRTGSAPRVRSLPHSGRSRKDPQNLRVLAWFPRAPNKQHSRPNRHFTPTTTQLRPHHPKTIQLSRPQKAHKLPCRFLLPLRKQPNANCTDTSKYTPGLQNKFHRRHSGGAYPRQSLAWAEI